MTDMIALDNEFVTLVFHPDTKIVHHTIHKHIGGEQFRSLLNQGTALLEKHGAIKWLSDNRLLGPLAPEDTQWSTTEWIPQTMAAGWKYWAMVVPDEIQARARLSHVIDTFYDKGLRIMVFTNLEDALEWLGRF